MCNLQQESRPNATICLRIITNSQENYLLPPFENDVPCLEFNFFWEKFVYTLVNTNCTFTGKCSFHKKEFTKSFEEIEKVNKLFLPFDKKLIHKRIFSFPN